MNVLRPLLDFATLLRRNAFPVAPDQTESFVAAVGLLGPRHIEDVHEAALALFAPPPERRPAFDALFRHHFHGDELPASGPAEDDTVRVQEPRDGGADAPDEADRTNDAGQAATRAELLSARRVAPGDPTAALRRLAREAPRRLPRRRGYRWRRTRSGTALDLRRTLHEAVRADGEMVRLRHRRRRAVPRRLLLLIDVSGSMKSRTDDNLRLAHTLVQATPRVEAFTIGTRLTRITRPLRLKRREHALAAAARAVSDFDGGTRIGDALLAFLAVPRFAGYASGAVTLVVSDGLERGDPSAMVDAVTKLRRRAWRLDWLTPLATTARFTPSTEALAAIVPVVDAIVPGGTTPAIVAHILALRRRAV